MGESVSYLPVRDFKVIRISCHHAGCNMVFELPPEKIEEAMKKTNGSCPLCARPFMLNTVHGGEDMVTALARVVLAMTKLATNVGIEFPISRN